ncbi:MAG: diguanylate cyclase domain-containing protein [Myxococcota bacterium]
MHDPSVRLFDFLDALPDAVLVIDARARVAHLNAAVTKLLGYTKEQLLGHPLSALIPPRFRDRHADAMKRFELTRTASAMERRPLLFALGRGGAEVPVTISLAPFEVDGERCTVAILRDASRFHQQLGEVTVQAETDPLTGLVNRRAALDRLGNLVSRDEPFALLFLDLVRFKQFNDQHGHHIGDEVLTAVAGRLRSSVRAPDTAARYGGDEFLVVMVGIKDRVLLQARAEAMADRLGQPMHVRTVTQAPGVTIGAALFPTHGATVEALLQNADQAMYCAKRAGKSYCLAGESPLQFTALQLSRGLLPT